MKSGWRRGEVCVKEIEREGWEEKQKRRRKKDEIGTKRKRKREG